MHRVNFYEDHFLLLINNDIRPPKEAVLIPEDPVLLCHRPVRPEVAEELGFCDAEALSPRLLAGAGVDACADRNAVERSELLWVFFKRLHLGCAEICPRERVEGEEHAFLCLFVEIKRLVVLIL